MNPTTNQPGFVYVIHATGTNRIKIGYSASPKDRLTQLQTGSPVPLQLLASWPGSVERERRVHRYLSQFRQTGEWFEVPPFVGLQIYELVTKGQITNPFHVAATRKKTGSSANRSTETTRRYNKTGLPSVETCKNSPSTWYVRLRWNQKPGRPTVYCCTLSDAEHERLRSTKWDEYKREIIALYGNPST